MAVNYQTNEDTMRPLVSATTSASSPDSHTPPPNPSGGQFCSRSLHIFPKSKAAFVILIWNIIVGFANGWVIEMIIGVAVVSRTVSFEHALYIMLGGYALIALAEILSYPVGGLIADLCFGRLKIVFFSLFKIWLAFLLFCVVGLTYAGYEPHDFNHHKVVMVCITFIAYVLLLAGFTGFQVNAVQFGLDQMLDSPSEELSVFLHWFVWTQSLGELLIRLFGAALPCSDILLHKIVYYIPIPICVVTGIILALSCYKHRWFHSEPCTQNPYGTVYRVLRFAAKRDRPLRPRSAMTYCDDERPTRIEFAKQRFGGPFTTETVEDVKTFLRILVMLFLITPLFNLHVSTAYIFPLYGLHMGSKPIIDANGCTAEWMLLQSGNLSLVISLVVIPLYLLFVHRHVPRCVPRILHRLVLGLAMIVVTVALMFGLLVIAKFTAIQRYNADNTHTLGKCMFLAEIRVTALNSTFSPPLDFSLPVLILPNLLTGIAVPFIYITILEFISAQSPHTMKGLLLGVFYACRGLFVMLGSLMVYFFAHKSWWDGTDESVYDCGFSYYLSSTVLGVIGLLVLSLAVKWYHYRKRQERPYDPSYVEDYYQRYATVASASPDEGEEMPLKYGHIDTSILTFGTMVGT